jgi:hypothetical protein
LLHKAKRTREGVREKENKARSMGAKGLEPTRVYHCPTPEIAFIYS